MAVGDGKGGGAGILNGMEVSERYHRLNNPIQRMVYPRISTNATDSSLFQINAIVLITAQSFAFKSIGYITMPWIFYAEYYYIKNII